MIVVVQRSREASCRIDGFVVGEISFGYVLLVGFTHSDTKTECDKMAKKIANLRVFEDEFGKLNKAIKDISGEILCISQFTLYANPYDGNRPGFTDAMAFDRAKELYAYFCDKLQSDYSVKTARGDFGADMKISLINDGPMTIVLDSQKLK